MENQNYNCVLNANTSAAAALDAIKSVSKWWAEDFEGSTQKLGDVFTVRFGKTYVVFKVVEDVAEKKTTWLVTDCYLPWLNDKTEWTDTSVVWEINGGDNSIEVSMTHVGLVPQVECFTMCEGGWNRHLKGSLNNLLHGQMGNPEKIKREAIQNN